MSSLVRLQRESKNKVEVITLKSDGYYVGILEHAGILVGELGITSLVTGIAAAIRLASIIRDFKPDIVQGWMYHGDLLATLGLGLSGRWRRTKLLWGVGCLGRKHANGSKSISPWTVPCAISRRSTRGSRKPSRMRRTALSANDP